ACTDQQTSLEHGLTSVPPGVLLQRRRLQSLSARPTARLMEGGNTLAPVHRGRGVCVGIGCAHRFLGSVTRDQPAWSRLTWPSRVVKYRPEPTTMNRARYPTSPSPS